MTDFLGQIEAELDEIRAAGLFKNEREIQTAQGTHIGVNGREIFETWYKMIAMLENGLDVSGIITHRFKADDFKDGFDTMRSGMSGKVVLDWT